MTRGDPHGQAGAQPCLVRGGLLFLTRDRIRAEIVGRSTFSAHEMISTVLPLYRVAAGFLIASLALRINGFDLLVDAIGWVLVVSGLSRLETAVDPAFGKARMAALVTLVLSFAELAGLTENIVIGLLYGASKLVTTWLVAAGIITRARAFGDASTASTFDAIRWILTIVSGVALLLGYTAARMQGIAFVVAITGFIVIAWFIISLYRSARLSYLA
ncbi:hypothetical protein [Microtetraspora malaysiensis]|uniref:hypothetical protein n=1 Tax=Microtetraspora malaysiensis TaxID=161358 RepID=UPI003D9354EF